MLFTHSFNCYFNFVYVLNYKQNNSFFSVWRVIPGQTTFLWMGTDLKTEKAQLNKLS